MVNMHCDKCNRDLNSFEVLPIYQHNPLCPIRVEWENSDRDSSMKVTIFHGKEWKDAKKECKEKLGYYPLLMVEGNGGDIKLRYIYAAAPILPPPIFLLPIDIPSNMPAWLEVLVLGSMLLLVAGTVLLLAIILLYDIFRP